ncbi:hypothetical protein SCHPADRAFT_947807 [Schizopora paradoxa]|uniref:Uncharacterized protein n=1 Tax=Schizopora paradoxa TaxID=27342 RepID=A0A0H2QZ94_9AGAM|nr:hypothetical protein SCHPADRAFT_947807 [Schizopora paradoxa]
MNDYSKVDIHQLEQAKLLVDMNPGQAFEFALNQSVTHTKLLSQMIQEIPEDIATKAIGMFANEIQRTDFEKAVSRHGYLLFDNRRVDALHAIANIGSSFFTKYAQAKKDVQDAMPALEKLLRLALDPLMKNSLRPRRRLQMLNIVRDVVSSFRNVDEGKAYLGRRNYWLPLISTWLTVVDSGTEEDVILSGLLVASDAIFRDEKGSKGIFLTQVFAEASEGDTRTKAKHIVGVALGRIRRAMSVFTVSGDDSILSSSLHVLMLLNETTDDNITALEYKLRDALVDLNGVHEMAEILHTGLEHSRWVTVSTTLGIVYRHFCAIASSTTIKHSLDIGLVKAVLDASKAANELNDIAHFSISALLQEYIPDAFLLRSVVKGFNIGELQSSFASDTDQRWRNIALVHESRRNLYHALVRRNGKERLPCANVGRFTHRN